MTPAISLRIRFSSPQALTRLVGAAEELGVRGVWVNEPWGFDAGAVLGAVAATTRRLLIGTHVCSVFARSPAATAGMAAALQRLSGGRFRLGLGTSGPQVVEGWHGVRYERPLARLRDTVAVVRTALAGDPVCRDVPGGCGVPLRFSQLGEAITVPVYLASLGPASQRLAAEVADGWTPTPYSPDHHRECAAALLGALEGTGRTLALAPVCPVAVGDDLPALFDLERGWSALYLGGMGTQEQNFYAAAARAMGHGEMVDRVAERWRAGDRSGARAAVDPVYADSIGLFGPPERIRERLRRYADAGIDELAVELRRTDLDSQLDDLRRLCEVAVG